MDSAGYEQARGKATNGHAQPGGEASAVREQPWPEPLGKPAFHGIVGEIVRRIEPQTEADPAALLFQLLTVAGAAIGPGPHVRVESDQHTPRLFTLLVGKTSKARKGTSWGRIREPLELAQPILFKARIISGLSTGEGLIHEVRDPAITADAKGNATTVDPGVSDKRLLVFEAEFARALKVMERNGNTLSAILRDAWDKGDLRVMTKATPARATGAHIAMVGHITGDELRRFLNSTDAANGLANRVLFCCARRSKLLPRGGGKIDWTAITPRLASALTAGGGIGQVCLTGTAWRIWDAAYPTLSDERPGLLGAVLARAEAQVIRLALIYALLDGQEFVDEPHLLAALAVWDYAEASAKWIFGDSLGDPTADEILRVLRATPAGMTRTELMGHFGRNLSSSEIGRALAVLNRDGLAEKSVDSATGGRPAERWKART